MLLDRFPASTIRKLHRQVDTSTVAKELQSIYKVASTTATAPRDTRREQSSHLVFAFFFFFSLFLFLFYPQCRKGKGPQGGARGKGDGCTEQRTKKCLETKTSKARERTRERAKARQSSPPVRERKDAVALPYEHSMRPCGAFWMARWDVQIDGSASAFFHYFRYVSLTRCSSLPVYLSLSLSLTIFFVLRISFLGIPPFRGVPLSSHLMYLPSCAAVSSAEISRRGMKEERDARKRE